MSCRGGRSISPAKEEFVDELHHLRLFLVDFEILVIAEECTVAHTGLALGELLALAPCGVLRDAATFLLSQRAHNRDQEFRLPPDIDTI